LLRIRIRGLFNPGSGLQDGKMPIRDKYPGSAYYIEIVEKDLLARRHKEDVPVGVVLYDDECIAGDGDVRFQLKINVIL
jgi:hypothetical protein